MGTGLGATGANVSCVGCYGLQRGHRGRCPSNDVAGNSTGGAPAPVPVLDPRCLGMEHVYPWAPRLVPLQ